MARRKRKNRYSLFFALIALLFTLYVNYSGNTSWQDIFQVFGVSETKSSTENYDNELSVHILDVGKADAIYIHCGDNDILIDAGDVEITNPVTEYLKRRNVEKLDLVMVSHPHRDHIGGMKDIVQNFPVERFMMPELPESITPTGRTYEKMLKTLKEKDIRVEKPVIGDHFEIGDMKFNIFAPVKKYDTVNNNSIVVQLVYGKNSFLFTGDAEKDSEKDILSENYNLKSDVLKVGHHGSATSTTQKWLDAIQPKYAVISVGPDRNNLPKASTIKRLQDSNIKIYRTDLNGTIVVRSNGSDITVSTEKEAA